MQKKKVIFYAPLGKDTPPEKIGGAEAGCLKTKAIYEKADWEVIVLNKPALSKGKIRFLLGMTMMPFKLLFTATRQGKNVPIHIVGFYNKIVKYEWILMKISHWCGHKVIYELRNGSMIYTYYNGNDNYRKYLRALLLQPEIVLCQGQEYIDFIKNQWGVERSYYPNYIMDDFLVPNNVNRARPLRLIYFGRVTESKNVDVSVKILAQLRKRGIDSVLEIIGGCSEEYKRRLMEVIRQEDVELYVRFYGRKPFDFIANKLRESHYFLFPSTEIHEGHSNSLTEAMGCGVVPIASAAGFNPSICGNKDLIIDGIEPNEYSKRILMIEETGKWAEYSNFVYQRIKNNYTENIVGKKLLSMLDNLYE